MKKLLSIVFALFLIATPVNISAAEGDIVDVASKADNYSFLVEAVVKADLVETLQGAGPFTVFSPTNQAFVDLLAKLDITKEQLLARADLKDILLYHVVAKKVLSTDLTDGMMPKTVLGETIKVDLSDGVKINDATVTAADIMATNGVIHEINTVLLPPAKEMPKAIVDIAVADDQFSILVASLTKAGLVDTLKGDSPFTVFAPTNTAFEALLKDLGVTAEELLAREDLKDILLYHVVSGKVLNTDLTDGMMPKTIFGDTEKIDLSDGVMVNDAKVVIADIDASNGVIHVLNKVLIPAAEQPPVISPKPTVPNTGIVTFGPYIGATLLSGLALIALKKKK